MKKKLISLGVLFFSAAELFSQSDDLARIHKQFISYQQQALQEKIFIHTDKNFYVAGEIIWFKLYNVDGQFHIPSNLSSLAYVEVLSSDRKTVLEAKIALKEGAGNGSFMLPSSVASGVYTIRGYTSWMKNSGAEYFFEKGITIVNTLKRPDWQKIESAPAYDLQFFPEGGHLVTGLESKIAFKATDAYGMGMDGQGFLLNQHNDTVARFQTHRFGMGQFLFKPTDGNTYRAVVVLNQGKSLIKELPTVSPVGYVMTLNDAGDGNITVTVTKNSNEYRSVYLLAHTRRTVKCILKGNMKDGKVVFVIPVKQLGDGISHFTVFDQPGHPVCERLYFKRPQQKMPIRIRTDEKVYKTRSKVRVDVEATEEADLSLSVFLIDSLQTLEQGNINNYLWLASDLKGHIETPDYYFQDTSREVSLALENLLLTQGWRRFKWEDISQEKKPDLVYLPEIEGHIITAKVTNKKTGAPVSGAASFLSIPGRHFRVASSESDEDGTVYFVVNKGFGTEEIIVQTEDSSQHVIINTPFSASFSTTLLPSFTISERWSDDLLKRSLSAQTANTYHKDNQQRFILPYKNDTTMFYGVPDKVYYLDDYTRFTTMEEVLREYVPEVRVRRNNNRFHYQVKNTPYKNYFETDPLVLLDGVPVDVSRIMAFDPLKIKKLEVVAREYFLNDLANKGIVSFTTYEEDLGGFELPANAIIIEYDGLQLAREFYSPAYETTMQAGSRIPDYRNLLYWSPNVRPGKDGKKQLTFYTSDIAGTYAMVLQGLDRNGVAGFEVIRFAVEK